MPFPLFVLPPQTSPFFFSLFIFLKPRSPLFQSLFSPFSLLFLLSVALQQCVWFATLPLSSKRGGKKPSSLLPLTPAKQNSLRSSSSLLYFPLALFTPQPPPGTSPAHKFLTSHKISVIGQENKHSAIQSESCLSSQSVSLLSS